ncbi:MAG: flagellar basal body P-ring formation protein FlgA [Ignavibacteriae bacterium]|nr:flagellar basal body P-ring formation protein FlgA [Ignavibacteriota bacterium]
MISLTNILLSLLILLGSNEHLDISKLLQNRLSNYKRFEYKVISPKNIDLTKVVFDDERETRLTSGYAYLPIKIKSFSNNFKNSTITVKLKLYEDVAVATRDLKRKDILNSNDFRIEEREVSSLRSNAITSQNKLNRIRTKKNIKSGAILQDNMFEPMPDIKKGDRILGVYQRGVVKINFDVIARTEGIIGETIKVKRTDNKIFRAVITNSKQVKIIE